MRQRIKALTESNPMLGTRGCRLGIQWPEIYEMQVRAIARAAKAVQERGGEAPLVEIMHPLVGFREELRRLRELTERVMEEEAPGLEYLCGTMIELPRAALRADEIAEVADFFSFGTNDLTQTALGMSRDDAEGKFLTFYLEDGVLERNPFEVLDQDGVGDLMRIAVERGRETKPEIKLGICGEHGGEPSSVEFCHRIGLDYVSCSPYRVPLARLAAAQAALKEAHRGRVRPGRRVTSGAPAPYKTRMKRGILCAACVAAAAICGGAAADPHHTVTKAEARARLSRLLGAKPQQMWRAWTDVGPGSVALEWRAYTPQARIRLEGGPAGVTVAPYYRGPAVAWVGVAGDGPIGVGSNRMRRRPVLPLRSTDIPASLVSALANHGRWSAWRRFASSRRSTGSRAISKLRSWGDRKGRLQGIWLVRFRRGGRPRTARVDGGDAPRPRPDPRLPAREEVHVLRTRRRSRRSSMRASGKLIEALTINGWKPQLPPG